MTINATRRQAIKSALLFSFCVAGQIQMMTPAAASEAKADLKVLSKTDAAILNALCERLVPGAKAAGVVYYIDAQLSAPKQDNLLMLSYLGFSAPHTDFYKSALQNISNSAQKLLGKALNDSTPQQIDSFIGDMAQDKLPDWQGLPASLVYFVLRADALDVRYGTQQGFTELNIPYMAHIAPETQW
jgi:hypothetical protein